MKNMFKKYALVMAVALTSSSNDLVAFSYSKHGNCTRQEAFTLTDPADNTQKPTKFDSKQIYCHTTGLRQAAVAVFFYGKAALFPAAKNVMPFSAAETAQLKTIFSRPQTSTAESANALYPVKVLLGYARTAQSSFGFNKEETVLLTFPDASENVYVKIEKEFGTRDGVMCVTAYGSSDSLQPHILELLKTIAVPNLTEDQSLQLPFTSSQEAETFARSCIECMPRTAIPDRIDFWSRKADQRSWSPFPFPAMYDKECLFVVENALSEKLEHVLSNATSAQNCYNQDGKQARLLLAWESDVVASGRLIKANAQKLNENHWNLIILNDLQREYSNAEFTRILDPVLNPDNTQIIKNLIVIKTPVCSKNTTGETDEVFVFEEVDTNSAILYAKTTFDKKIPTNEGILRVLTYHVCENLQTQPAFPYKNPVA